MLLSCNQSSLYSLKAIQVCRLQKAITCILGNHLPSSSIPPSLRSTYLNPFYFLSQRYGQLYDLSRSERSKVRELAVTMAMEGQPLERISELLHVAVGPLHLSVKTVLQDAVEKVVAALR